MDEVSTLLFARGRSASDLPVQCERALTDLTGGWWHGMRTGGLVGSGDSSDFGMAGFVRAPAECPPLRPRQLRRANTQSACTAPGRRATENDTKRKGRPSSQSCARGSPPFCAPSRPTKRRGSVRPRPCPVSAASMCHLHLKPVRDLISRGHVVGRAVEMEMEMALCCCRSDFRPPPNTALARST